MDEMNGLLWFFAAMLFAGNGGFFGNRGGYPGPAPEGNYVTQADLTAGLNNATTQSQLNQIALSSANNNYETARLIASQSTDMLQQNNTNLINVIQGFNAVTNQLQNQTSSLSQQISQLGFKLDNCCCDIKTQMLQDRLADTQARLVTAQNQIDNRDQTQTILSNLGRFVAWAGSGSPAATASVAG